MPVLDLSDVMDKTEVRQYLGLGERQVNNLMDAGELVPVRRFGQTPVFSRADVDALAERRRQARRAGRTRITEPVGSPDPHYTGGSESA